MHAFQRIVTRVALIGALVAVGTMSLGNVQARGTVGVIRYTGHASLTGGFDRAAFRHLTGTPTNDPAAKGKTHIAYIDEGMCPGLGGGNTCDMPDNIEVWSLGSTPSLLQTFPTGGGQVRAFFGSNTLALSKLGCLVYANRGDSFNGGTSNSGSWESFSLNKKTGQIVNMVSNVPSLGQSFNLQIGPEDVHVIDGKTSSLVVGVDNSIAGSAPDALEYLPLNKDCSLGTPQFSTGASGSEFYVNAAIASPTRVVATDETNNSVDTFQVGPGSSLSVIKEVPENTSVAPDGIFVKGAALYTGGLGAPDPPAYVSGAKYSSGNGNATWLKNSPGSDPNGTYDVPVSLDTVTKTVTGGDENGVSLLSNFKSDLTYLNTVPLQVGGQKEVILTQFGTSLWVDARQSGDNELCAESSAGAHSCSTYLVLANPQGYEGGLQIR